MSKASELAYRYIRGSILEGRFAAGTQLREEFLAEACGVSRTPVREALRRLESEHFIRRTESQRTFVADWSIDEIGESFVLRAMLEGHAAARAAERIEDSAITALIDLNRAIQRTVEGESIDVDAFLDNNRDFHGIILKSAGSERLAAVLGGLIEQPILLRTARQYDREQILRSFSEHDELVLAFRRRDPDWARAVMTAHIRRAFHAYRDAFLGAPGAIQVADAAE
ncbi:MAG: GntR family transcriptional regulator [Sphingosinicella sp.]|uniref:GntR family transcriptional regulator n=1 Tax=Sphingosinicella sp. TaxID=1917971 RepID=UPI0040381410